MRMQTAEVCVGILLAAGGVLMLKCRPISHFCHRQPSDVQHWFPGGIDLEEFATALKTEQWTSRNILGTLAGVEVCIASMLVCAQIC